MLYFEYFPDSSRFNKQNTLFWSAQDNLFTHNYPILYAIFFFLEVQLFDDSL